MKSKIKILSSPRKAGLRRTGKNQKRSKLKNNAQKLLPSHLDLASFRNQSIRAESVSVSGGQKSIDDWQNRSKKEIGLNQKNKFMATKEILEKAKKELVDLTGFKSPSAVGFKKEGNDLIATIEVIEKKSIPDGMDVLGTYEVRVDEGGKILGYERTDLRKRVDTALNKEV